MNTQPEDEQKDPATDADSSSEAMNDQLRSDVTSWRAARSETTARESAELTVPVVRAPTVKHAARTKQPKPAPAAIEPADAKKKPFGMSYDGMSQADYITYMISRGAR